MLNVSEVSLARAEKDYPGIRETVMSFENADLPNCPTCGGDDTASVTVGVVGRSMYLSRATTKAVIVPNGPREGEFYCNSCKEFYG